MLVAAVLVAASVLPTGCDTRVPPVPPVATATAAEPTPVLEPKESPTIEDLTDGITDLPPVESTPVPTAAVDAEERLAIYRQVVLLLAGAERARVVYISPYTGAGERLDVTMTDRPVPSALLPALRQADPATTFELAEFIDVVGPLEKGGAVETEGALVTLGPVEDNPEPEGGVSVRASVYRSVSDAGGYTYELRRAPSEPSGWVVTRTTQDWLDTVP